MVGKSSADTLQTDFKTDMMLVNFVCDLKWIETRFPYTLPWTDFKNDLPVVNYLI